MNHLIRLLCVTALMLQAFVGTAKAAGQDADIKEVVLEHIKDSYDWHITDIGDKPLVIHLPVIVNSSTGFHVFSSARFSEEADANGYKHGPFNLAIATKGDNAGKIVEIDSADKESRPFDISITKTVAVMFINVIILFCCILIPARWYRNRKVSDPAPKGFTGFIEMLVMYVVDEIIKPGVGKGYEKYTPYLLTCFFFIFVCNVMGLMPFPPGGGNVTGNIAVTFFLALCTFIIVQFSGNKHYWKDIFWPDVPTWLKAPIPLIPVIEFVGIFTKPFALMIRLFANMMAGHAVILSLTCVIFVTVKMGAAINGAMTVVSVAFSIFMNCLELLVAFLQAYVFTMLSAVFIGLAQEGKAHTEQE